MLRFNDLRLAPAATATDASVRDALLASLDVDGQNRLTAVTGLPFGRDRRPDFLAVRTGLAVSGKLWGGFTTAGWKDREGSVVSWFGVGSQPHAYLGVAVIYAPAADRRQRQHIRTIAMSLLLRSLTNPG